MHAGVAALWAAGLGCVRVGVVVGAERHRAGWCRWWLWVGKGLDTGCTSCLGTGMAGRACNNTCCLPDPTGSMREFGREGEGPGGRCRGKAW